MVIDVVVVGATFHAAKEHGSWTHPVGKPLAVMVLVAVTVVAATGSAVVLPYPAVGGVA